MVSWFSDLLQTHSALMITIGSLSLLTFAGTILILPVLLIRIPEDYFLKSGAKQDHKYKGNIIFHIAKNLAGILFLLMGFIMLFIPGQGLLTILAGLWLMDFPGKRALEVRIIHTKSIYRGIDYIRRKAGKPSLKL
ncbi:PGPGW domain-containing protein [Oceanispirochaeta crateris]|nr:PGPGW domain-containing protein [Oceanispirochaeta crateris]